MDTLSESPITGEPSSQASSAMPSFSAPSASSSAPMAGVNRKRSRGIIIAVSVAVVVLIILVLMFTLGGGFNITASEVALGLAAVAITGVAAYVIGKKVGKRLEDSVKHHAHEHKFL